MFRHEKDTLHVGGEYLVPFFLRNLFEIACKRLDTCASIVAKNVKAPELSLDRFDHSNHASLDAYVALNQQRFRALRFALGRGLFRLTLAATVVDHHVVSCPRKSDGLGSTDARRRTSDQGDSLLFAHPDSPVCVESRFRSISRGRKNHSEPIRQALGHDPGAVRTRAPAIRLSSRQGRAGNMVRSWGSNTRRRNARRFPATPQRSIFSLESRLRDFSGQPAPAACFRSTAIRESGGSGNHGSRSRKIGVKAFSSLICPSPKVFLRKMRPFSHQPNTPTRLNFSICSTRNPACTATCESWLTV